MLDDDDFYESLNQASLAFDFQDAENISPNVTAYTPSNPFGNPKIYSATETIFPTGDSPVFAELEPLQPVNSAELQYNPSQLNDQPSSFEPANPQSASHLIETQTEQNFDLHLADQSDQQNNNPDLNGQSNDDEPQPQSNVELGNKDVQSEQPYQSTSTDQLKDSVYLQILNEFDNGSNDKKLNNKKKVYRPNPGDLFVFKSSGQETFEKFPDGYCWHRDGGKVSDSLDKRFFKVAYYPSEAVGTKQVKDGRFKQRIYFLRKPQDPAVHYTVVHYTGSNEFVTTFGSHANAKSKKFFCTSRATDDIKQTIKTNPSNVRTYAEIKKQNEELPFKSVNDPRSLNQIAYRRQQAKFDNRNYVYDWSAVQNLCFHGLSGFIRRIQLCKLNFNS